MSGYNSEELELDLGKVLQLWCNEWAVPDDTAPHLCFRGKVQNQETWADTEYYSEDYIKLSQ